MEYPTPAPNSHRTQIPLTNQGKDRQRVIPPHKLHLQLINRTGNPPQTYHDEGFQDFRDFVNFIDGVGLSAQWSPEFGFDWLQGEQQSQHQQHHLHEESVRQSREPEAIHTPEPEDIGTPFSTWLPSAPADDQVHLRSHSGDGM